MCQVLREATEKPYLDINQPALRVAISTTEAAGTDGSGGMLTRAVLGAPQPATLLPPGAGMAGTVSSAPHARGAAVPPSRQPIGRLDASLGQSVESRAFRFT